MDHLNMAKLRSDVYFESSLNLDEMDAQILKNQPNQSQSINQTSVEFPVDSNYYESIVICNDIDVEDEMKKVKDEDESVFKMLSMSFYDKAQLHRPFKTHNPSPACFDDLNIVTSSKNHAYNSRGTKIRAKQSSQPNPSHGKEAVSVTVLKHTKTPDLLRPTPTPPPKLFSINEKNDGTTLLSQISTQRINLGAMVNNHRALHGQNVPTKNFKSPGKQNPNSTFIKQQKSPSPRKEAIMKGTASGEKLKNVDLSTIIRTQSPYLVSSKSIKPINTQTTLGDSNTLLLTLSPRGFEVKSKPKLDIEKSKSLKSNLGNKKLSLESARKQIIKPEGILKPSSPVPVDFTLNRTAIINNIEAKRAKLNHATYISSTKGLKEKVTRNLEVKTQKLNETMSQPIKPMKVDLGKSYKKSQSSTKNSSGSTTRGNFPEPKTKKTFKPNLPQKVILDQASYAFNPKVNTNFSYCN